MSDYGKLDPEAKREWVEALRSGKYKQTKGALRHGDAFCCLGVECEISGEGRWAPGAGEWEFVGRGSDNRSYGDLPDDLRGKIGLSIAAQVNLIRMNDTGSSFAEIADWIEANL